MYNIMEDFQMDELKSAVGREMSVNQFKSRYPKYNGKLIKVNKANSVVLNLNDNCQYLIPNKIAWNILFF